MKALRITAIVLATLLVVGGALATWSLCTQGGTRALYSMAQRWLPAGVGAEEVAGTVAGTLHVRNFRYHDPAIGMDLRIASADVDLAPFALLARTLHVERLQARDVTLEFSEPTPPPVTPPPTPARNPWLAPIDMRVDELLLTHGEWRRVDAPLLIGRGRLAGSWIGTRVLVETLELQGSAGELSLNAALGEREPLIEQLHAKFRWRGAGHEWAGAVDASGRKEGLQLEAALSSPVDVKLSSRLAPGRDPDTWHTQLSVSPFDPRPLLGGDAVKRIGVELEAEGNARDLALRGEFALDDERIHLEKLVLSRREKLLNITGLAARLNRQPARLTGSATLALDGSKPLSAHLAWDEFALPEAWAGAQFRCAGQVALTASARRYAINSSARLARGERLTTLSLRIDGTPAAAHIEEFELTQTPGALSIQGNVDLGTPVGWHLTANARAFDPSLFLEQWPGALDFDLRSTGEWPQSGPRARFELMRLSGRLRKRPISGNGDLRLGPDRKPSGTLQLQSGGVSLHAVATRGPAPRVDATLHIAALEEWRKDLAGALHLEATAVGRWPDVSLDAKVNGHRLRGGGAQLESANLRLSARDARAPRGKLELQTQGVEFSGLQFERVAIALEGDAQAHALTLAARGKPVSLELQASGEYSRRSWSGTLAKLGVGVERIPPLSLAEPAHVALAPGSFDLGRTCLTGGDIAVCAAVRHANRESTAHYSVRALPLGLLVALAAPQAPVIVEGLLEGSGDLRRAGGGPLTGRATLGSRTGALIQGDTEDAVRLEYRDLGVDLELTPESAHGQLRGVLVKQGNLGGSLDVAMSQADPALDGKANLALRDLSPLGWWMPQLANLRGSGELLAEVDGTLNTPRFAFTVRGSGLEAEVPLLGVQLRDGSVDAGLQPDGAFNAQGTISSGDGALKLGGGRDQRGLALQFTGTRFLAANVPGARVTIAPDLALTGKVGALALAGTVKIESAEVNLEKLSIARTYKPSGDVVIVDREVKMKDDSLGLATDVRIVFGDQVKLAGYGLDATVGGELRVVETRDQPGRATGEIRLAGTYEAFGRKLTIERGRLQFAGTALDDPQLDILAFRKIDEVTAKLRVTGTAQNPKLDVFTEPAMSQTDAMSYLLTGKSASDLHGNEGNDVQSAAQSLGGVLGNRLAKKLGGKVGFVDQVGVEQNNDLGGSAFTVGKYLSPKLFVSYGVGLFEPGSAITVRYQFSERWSLEANDSPEDSHAGVRYRIEK